MRIVLSVVASLFAGIAVGAVPMKGSVQFEPLTDQKNIPERYRLSAHRFDWEMDQARRRGGSQ